MPEQPEKIEIPRFPADQDAEKKRALEALQPGAEQLSDAFLRDALARNNVKEGGSTGNEAGVDLNAGLPEQPPTGEPIPLSGGIPELNTSMQNGQETVGVIETRVENIMKGNVDFNPDSAVEDIGRVIEEADKE